MTDRLVKLLENGRCVTRGLTPRSSGVQIELDDDEALTVTFEWAGWLGSDTIASTANETTGTTAGAITTNGTQTSFQISGNPGLVQHRITTTTSGETKEVRLFVASPCGGIGDDYGMAVG